MNIQWQQLSLPCPSDQAELLEGILLALGAVSVTFEDAHDQPILEPGVGQTPLWPEVVVSCLFAVDADIPTVLEEAKDFMNWASIPMYTIKPIMEQAWERAWLEHFKPMRFGSRLWICPSNQEPVDPTAVNIILDPGLAFGTGTHPTTNLCLQWLDQTNLVNRTVIDYGCGSGILGIAAVKLDAQIAHCVDNDPQALIATVDNAQRNGLNQQQILTYLPDALPLIQTDILVANILAKPLAELAPYFATLLKPGGQFALSGILDEQVEMIKEAYQSDFLIQDIVVLENWVRVSGIKRLIT
jgi:ribosomal protein L11 methyltransferase